MDVPLMMYSDPALIDTIVGELKSQGTFDQFRKECIADVDTKPAYQNLHQRVETTVSNFLEGRTWRSDLNKNQLRDSLRKHILEMGFLDTGVERIVDQVVNPKVHAVFMLQVEDVVYRVQGIPKPEKKATPISSSAAGSASKTGGAFSASLFNQPPPFLPGLSFLPPALQSHIQKAPTLSDLLPTDLDPVSSPESSKDSDLKDSNVAEESGIIRHHDDSMESQLSGISDLTSHGSDHAANVKSERRGSVPFDDTNEDVSNSSLKDKVLDELEEPTSNRVQEYGVTRCDTEDQHDAGNTSKTSFEDGCEKSSYTSGPVMHYEDQYTVEEEVATTLNTPHCDVSDEVSIKEETGTSTDEKKKSSGNVDSIENNVAEDDLPETKTDAMSTVQPKYEGTDDISSNHMDDNSLAQSEDSQFSGSSDNKLHIDELKDFNSQSENSHQNDDDQSGMKTSSEGFLSEDSSKPNTTMENVVEASEEARHGFDDSQDALERPPLPSTPPAPQDLMQPPPLPPFDSSSYVDEKLLRSSSPPSVQQSEHLDGSKDGEHTVERLSQTPPLPVMAGSIENSFTPRKYLDEEPKASVQLPFPSTPPSTESPYFEECPPLPPTPGTMDYPPLPPPTPPLVECPPLPPTPPLPECLNVTGCPPLPPTPPLPERPLSPDRPQLPPTPPLAHRLNSLECPTVSVGKELNVSISGPPEDEFSRDSNMSPSYDEGAIPKTPQWEPRSPSAQDTKHPLSSFEFLGISDPSKIQKSFIPFLKNNTNEQDDVSRSGSEEMQLAWSPLSNHDGEVNEDGEVNDDSKGKQSAIEVELSSTLNLKESINEETNKDIGVHSSDRHRDTRRDDKHKSSEGEKHKERDRGKDSKSNERRKDDSHCHKEAAYSTKKPDETKHKESRERRDSSSRSRHEEKGRSGKDRDRHSSSSSHHNKRRDEKRDDKERTSSSKHKSSHSDDRHRHRDKDYKSISSGSTQEEKSKTSSKSHSSDRERRDQDRKERDSKDRDRKSDKEKDRYRKESSRHDDKRKVKEREKNKKDRSSNVCRPHNERRSSDPDSNNGSTFGGNNQTSSEGINKSSQYQDSNNQSNEKGSGSVDSNSKSSETSQTNNCGVDSLFSPTSNQVCPSSSLPFKKRPLLPESDCDAKLESSSGQLLLKIKRSKSYTNVKENSQRRKIKAIRRLERMSISSLDNSPKFALLGYDANASPPPNVSESPTQYFETDWPTRLDDKAFLAYVKSLEHSKTLSGLSDYSQSDSEEEEIMCVDGFKSEGILEGKNVMLSVIILSEDESKKLVDSTTEVDGSKRKERKMSVPKSNCSYAKGKSRSRPKKVLGSDVEVKRRKLNSKVVGEEITAAEPKSRRARKPNKRYSNDEFTSHFDYEDDLEQSENEHKEANSMVGGLQTGENVELVSESHATRSPVEDFSTAENTSQASVDDSKKLKENTMKSSIQSASEQVSHSSKIVSNQTKQTSYCWNRDSYNSNSEDEADNTNNESDLIGTALKNLMMESGLGGPVGASSSQKPTRNIHHKLPQLLGQNQKLIPLSGVKRVGLSKHYKGGKTISAKPAIAAIACSEFSFPPSPDSDVSASSFEKGFPDVK